MSDIDIERLREAVNLHRSDFIRDEAGNFIWDVTAEGEALWLAAEFLVSLADQGGELCLLFPDGKWERVWPVEKP